MNIDKKIKLSKKFASKEIYLMFVKKIKTSTKPSLAKKISLQSRVFFSFMSKKLYINRFRNFCNFSSKPRGLLRDLKVSSYSLKDKARKLSYLGVKRASG